MKTLAGVLLAYTALFMSGMTVSVSAFGINTTLLVFGILECASVLVLVLLAYGEGRSFSGRNASEPEQPFSPASEQLALLRELMERSSGRQPILAYIARLPRKS